MSEQPQPLSSWPNEAPPVPGEEAFRAFLQRRTGFVMPEDRWRFLAPRFLGRLAGRGFPAVEAYVRYLEHDPRGRAELEEIYNILTVRKTSFFRNPGTFAALEREVLPRIVLERRSRLPVSIWSAGCSTGEEAYSLAMVASEVLTPAEQTFHVLATDIVKEALQRGRDGVYPEASLMEVPFTYRRYTRHQGGMAWVDEALREHVEFAAHNLVHDPAPRAATGSWDVIFCRNVLIYFGMKEAREVIDRFARVLAPGGALFLGSAEVFTDMEPDFEVVFSGDTFFYRRRHDVRADPLLSPVITEVTPAPRVDPARPPTSPPARSPLVPPAPDPGSETRSLLRPGLRDDTTRSARRPDPAPPPAPRSDAPRRSLSESGRLPRPKSDTGRYSRLSESGRFTRPPGSSRADWGSKGSDTGRVERAVHDAPTARGWNSGTGDTPTRAVPRGWPTGQGAQDGGDDTRADLRNPAALPHDQVLEAERKLEADDREGAARALRAAITRAPRWARPRILLATVYLRAGAHEDAQRQLEVASEVEPLDPRAHYMLGKVRTERGDLARAEESFRRALYLEPDYLAARFGLARALQQGGRADRACKELRAILRALRAAAATGQPLARDALDGFTPQELKARAESAISALGGRLSLDESTDDIRKLL